MGPGPTLNSRSMNKRYACVNIVFLSEDGDTTKRSDIGNPTTCRWKKDTEIPHFTYACKYQQEKLYFSGKARQGLKIKADADDEVLHEIALTLAEARKDGSPLISRIPHKRAEDVMSSLKEPYQPKEPIAEMNESKLFAIGMDVEDLEGQIKAVIGERSRHKPYIHDGTNKLRYK